MPAAVPGDNALNDASMRPMMAMVEVEPVAPQDALGVLSRGLPRTQVSEGRVLDGLRLRRADEDVRAAAGGPFNPNAPREVQHLGAAVAEGRHCIALREVARREIVRADGCHDQFVSTLPCWRRAGSIPTLLLRPLDVQHAVADHPQADIRVDRVQAASDECRLVDVHEPEDVFNPGFRPHLEPPANDEVPAKPRASCRPGVKPKRFALGGISVGPALLTPRIVPTGTPVALTPGVRAVREARRQSNGTSR